MNRCHRRTVCQDCSPVPVAGGVTTTLTTMRIARLLSLVLAVLTAGVLLAPGAAAEPPFRVPDYVTDRRRRAVAGQRADVENAVDQLYNDRRIRLWVVYVDSFSGQDAVGWAEPRWRLSDFGERGCDSRGRHRGPRLRVPASDLRAPVASTSSVAHATRSNPRCARATGPGPRSPPPTDCNHAHRRRPVRRSRWCRRLVVALAVLALAMLVLWLFDAAPSPQAARGRVRRRAPGGSGRPERVGGGADRRARRPVQGDRRRRRQRGAHQRQRIGAWRSRNSAPTQTEPFSRAVGNAKTTLAQAFNVRQILDDAVPETPQQRRDLLTRVIVAAAKADRELDAQTEAFEKLRDLVINAPSRLDALTQQMVDLTARIGPSEQALAALHNQFSDAALASVAGNVETAKQRLGFADQNITNGRTLVARPAGPAVRPGRRDPRGGIVAGPGPFAAGRGRQRRHRHQPGGRRTARGDRRHPERHQPGRGRNCSRAIPRTPPSSAQPATPRSRPSPTLRSNGTRRSAGRVHPADPGRRRTGPAAGQRHRGARGRRTARPRIRPGAVHRAVAGQGVLGLHRHPPRQHRSRSAHPAGRGGPPTSGRAGQAGHQPQRSDRARQRCRHAGRAGAVDGQRRRPGRAAVLHRPATAAAADPNGCRHRRHHHRQHPQSARCAAASAAASAAGGWAGRRRSAARRGRRAQLQRRRRPLLARLLRGVV